MTDDDGTPAEATALTAVRAGIDAASPARVVADRDAVDGDHLQVADATYDLSDVDRVVVVGAGKAAAAATSALERVLGDRLDAGAVVVPPSAVDDGADGRRVERLPGDHPVPSERGVESTRRVRELVAEADDGTLVLAVVTGGGSALLAAPAEGVELEALRAVTASLLDAGADVEEVNAVRKHCSAVKGGRLAALAAPATVVGLVFSDVVADDRSVVASGPTAPDPTTYADAADVLDRYGVEADAVRARLDAGARGEVAETPAPGDPVFDRVTNHVLANGRTALRAARATARERGYGTCLLSALVRGEAREAARTHTAVALEAVATGDPVEPPAVILAGGECTVTVTGDGEGGPNTEFALSSALDLREAGVGERVAVAAVDTDGADGGTDAAGALVDGTTVADAGRARAALDANDSLAYLDDRDAVVRTGPTGTNVNDLRVAVVERAEHL